MTAPASGPRPVLLTAGPGPVPPLLAGGGRPAGLGPYGVWPPPVPAGSDARRDRTADPPTLPLRTPDRRALASDVRFDGRFDDRRPVDGRFGAGGPDTDGWDGRDGDRRGGGSGRLRGALRRLAPAAWREARVDPGRPGATALALVAAAAAIAAAVGVWVQRPQAEPVRDLPAVTVASDSAASASDPPAAPSSSPPAGSSVADGDPAPDAADASAPGATGAGATGAGSDGAGSSAAAAPLVVAVSGRVHRPGLVEVPVGARVADVLDAAGGALPGTDLAGVNLARRVVDGEQVAVGVPPAPDAAPAGPPAPPAAGPTSPAGRIDLNAATIEQLDVLPGVGPVTAQRILDWRTQNGRFARVEQLREIEGIGERRFAQLRELVTV